MDATQGTRLYATFSNLPSGAILWASNQNIKTVGATLGTNDQYGAVLVGQDYTAAGPAASLAAPGTAALPTWTALTPNGNGFVTAVWEVTNDTNAVKGGTATFGIYIQYSSEIGLTTAASPVTLNAGLAPYITPDPAKALVAKGNAIPRFNTDSNGTPISPVFTTTPCSTVLMFPYAVNQEGYDTGIAIANTSMDMLGAKGASSVTSQAGSCTLDFFGSSAPATAPLLPALAGGTQIAAGALGAGTVGSMAPGFEGYIIAICNFQFAHGYAYVTNGTTAQDYLGLVLKEYDGRRAPEALNN